jgi:rhodanese-related sulfurtransferase
LHKPLERILYVEDETGTLTVAGVLLAFAAVLAVPLAKADDSLTPTVAKGVQVISVEQARSLVGRAPFFDARRPLNFGKGHIKGAVALPYAQKSDRNERFDAAKDKLDMARLPEDKSSPIVFYSEGPSGWKAYKSAVLAARAGYSDVRWLRDGIAGWVAKGGDLE